MEEEHQEIPSWKSIKDDDKGKALKSASKRDYGESARLRRKSVGGKSKRGHRGGPVGRPLGISTR